MEFPENFITTRVTIEFAPRAVMSNPWYEMANAISLSADLEYGDWTAQGPGNSSLTKEQVLESLIVGFKAAAQNLADVTGRPDVFLTSDSIQVIFEGVAGQTVSISTEPEEE